MCKVCFLDSSIWNFPVIWTYILIYGITKSHNGNLFYLHKLLNSGSCLQMVISSFKPCLLTQTALIYSLLLKQNEVILLNSKKWTTLLFYEHNHKPWACWIRSCILYYWCKYHSTPTTLRSNYHIALKTHREIK